MLGIYLNNGSLYNIDLEFVIEGGIVEELLLIVGVRILLVLIGDEVALVKRQALQ
jgi:hypothetical protein